MISNRSVGMQWLKILSKFLFRLPARRHCLEGRSASSPNGLVKFVAHGGSGAVESYMSGKVKEISDQLYVEIFGGAG